MADTMIDMYDVVVVGGGGAGLSGALLLARSLRSVLVIDAGEPLNAPAAAVHGFLSRDGISPSALTETGRSEVRWYGGHVVNGRVRSISREGEGFAVTLDDDQVVGARRLLVTTGSVAELPDVPGVRERWGRDVLHCPYCHGWEVRDQVVGILASGPMTVHGALLFRQLTPHVTVFLDTAPQPSDDEREQLVARGISVVDGEVARLEVTDDHLTGIRLRTGMTVSCDALAVAPRFIARADLLINLGVEVTEHPLGAGTYVESDDTGLTTVRGVWVAGVLANPRLQVMGAAASGTMAAAAINADLIAADTARAVSLYRDASSSESNIRSASVRHGDALPDALSPSSTMAHAPGEHCHDHHGGGSPHIAIDQGSWEERYRSSDALWSGNPNPQLVSQASDLSPGTALDVGCGEGADAIWLAERGWRVSAVDFSTVALERGAARAMVAGSEVAERITWIHADLTAWVPPAESFDLVSSQFMHLPSDQREPLYRRLAESVAPGGTLLVVGHHPSDMQTSMPRPAVREFFFTGDDLAASLDRNNWETIVNAEPARTAIDPEGNTVTIHDAVLRARRRL